MMDLVLDMANIARVQKDKKYQAGMDPGAKVQALQGSHAQTHTSHVISRAAPWIQEFLTAAVALSRIDACCVGTAHNSNRLPGSWTQALDSQASRVKRLEVYKGEAASVTSCSCGKALTSLLCLWMTGMYAASPGLALGSHAPISVIMTRAILRVMTAFVDIEVRERVVLSVQGTLPAVQMPLLCQSACIRVFT